MPAPFALNTAIPDVPNATVATLLNGEHYVCNRCDQTATRPPWCPRDPAVGCRASALFPLRQSGPVIGALCLCAGEPAFFDPETVALLDEMARSVSLALDTLAVEGQRALAVAALRESESKYRRIIETAKEGIWMLDAENRTTFVNPQMAEMLGYTPEELISRSTESFLFPEDLADHQRQTSARQRGLSGQYERRLRRKEGSTFWAQISVSPIRLEDGTFNGSFAMFTDISQRKAAEEALHALSGRLLQLQDEERRRIARELHDTTLQNLAALGMNLSSLWQALPPNVPRSEQLVDDCAHLAEKTAQEIRALSHLLHPPVLDMMGLPGALKDFINGFTQRTGIQIEIDLPPAFGRLPSDIETALYRIVQESLSNIHRHSGSPTARVTLARDHATVTLTVADAGKGIPDAILKSAETGATSLGLGIAGMRERLRQLGGELQILSGPDGTRIQANLTVPNPADSRPPDPAA